MQLKEFNLISPVIESSHVFKAIETAIPIEVIEETIGNTKVREERKRKLPARLVVCLVIAMSIWSNAKYRTKNVEHSRNHPFSAPN